MEDRPKYSCPKCGAAFADNTHLRRHLARKTPCEAIVRAAPLGGEFACRFCNRGFTSKSSMYRHVRQFCKIASSEDGMDKLMEHTLQRQIAEQSDRIDRLTALLEQNLTTGAIAPYGTRAAEPSVTVNTGVVNTGAITNNVTHNNITIVPWDGDRRIAINIRDITAAFAGNARLREYTGYGDYELADHKIASPYVTELLMDLVKRGHATPESRNVYLNPRRADQVLVHLRTGRWEVLPLEDATRLLFDGVAAGIHRVVLSDEERRQLPLEAQNALAIAGMLYEEEPDQYVQLAKAPLTAHLMNTAPETPGAKERA